MSSAGKEGINYFHLLFAIAGALCYGSICDSNVDQYGLDRYAECRVQCSPRESAWIHGPLSDTGPGCYCANPKTGKMEKQDYE